MNKSNILVKEWMSQPVKVVHPDTSVGDAYYLMMERGIRRLPVVNAGGNGRLVGIVTLGDLREARSSPASSQSIYELHYMLSKLTVAQVMTHNPYTVEPDTTIQGVARVMLERKIGGLPVINKEERPIGIITESDIFRMLLDRWDYFTSQRIDPGLVASLIAEEVNK